MASECYIYELLVGWRRARVMIAELLDMELGSEGGDWQVASLPVLMEGYRQLSGVSAKAMSAV